MDTDTASRIAEQVKGNAARLTEAAAERAGEIAEEVREAAGEVLESAPDPQPHRKRRGLLLLVGAGLLGAVGWLVLRGRAQPEASPFADAVVVP